MEFASSVPDFRRLGKGNIKHCLDDSIMLLMLGRAYGCVGRADIIEFGRHNLNKFRKIGMLLNGVPSEATLCRIENGMDETALADRMQEFAQIYQAKLLKDSGMEIICVDGKAERGTVLENGCNPDIVSAYSPSIGITLATEAYQEKSNEIKAVPLLVDKLDMTGKILSADAMSMQKDIIDCIRKKGGDFLIELKANQWALFYGVEDGFRNKTPQLGAIVRTHWSIESMHWGLNINLLQDKIKRRTSKAAHNLDTRRVTKKCFFTLPVGLLSPADWRLRPLLGVSRAHARSLRDFSVSPSPFGEGSEKEGRQEKRNGRDYETHLCKFYETHQLFMTK